MANDLNSIAEEMILARARASNDLAAQTLTVPQADTTPQIPRSMQSRFVDVLEIPFTARPQILTVWLGDFEFTVRLYWLTPAKCWVIDLADIYGNRLISGIPLVTGTDLFDQFQYTEVKGGRLVVMSTDRPPETVPGWGDLGVTGHVYWRARPSQTRYAS